MGGDCDCCLVPKAFRDRRIVQQWISFTSRWSGIVVLVLLSQVLTLMFDTKVGRGRGGPVPSVMIFSNQLRTLLSPWNTFSASGSLRREYSYTSNSIENEMISWESTMKGYLGCDGMQIFRFLVACWQIGCEKNERISKWAIDMSIWKFQNHTIFWKCILLIWDDGIWGAGYLEGPFQALSDLWHVFGEIAFLCA
jgi:hypothetical protein